MLIARGAFLMGIPEATGMIKIACRDLLLQLEC